MSRLRLVEPALAPVPVEETAAYRLGRAKRIASRIALRAQMIGSAKDPALIRAAALEIIELAESIQELRP